MRLIALLLLCLPGFGLSQQVTSHLVTQIGTLDGVRLVAISPNNKLALTSTGLTTSKDYSICLWDVATGRELKRFSNHTDNVRDLAFSPDNRSAASASNDKTVRIWNLETGAEVQRLDHPDPVLAIVYSPDGKYLLTGTTANLIGEGGFGYQWDVATGNKVRTFPNHKKGIPAVAWSANGKLLATAGWDNVVSLFNADTGTLVNEIKEPATIIALAFSPDSRMIAAAGGTDDTVHIVDVATGKEVQKIKCQTAPYSVMFSPNGSQLLVANKFPDKKVHLWDLKTENEARNFFGSTQAVMSSDGRYVLTAADDSGAALFETTTGKLIRRFESLAGNLESLDVSPDGNYLATLLAGYAMLWNLRTGSAKLIDQGFEVNRGESFLINDLAFSPDSKSLITGEEPDILTHQHGGIQIWNAATAERKLRIPTQGSGPVAMSPDGKFIVSGRGLVLGQDTTDREAHLYEVETGKEKKKFGNHSSTVERLALSKDGSLLLTQASIINGAIDDAPRLWEVNSGRERFRLAPNNAQDVRASALALSPDGALACAAHFTQSNEAVVFIWDTATGHEKQTLKGHADQINWITFSNDGKIIVTASNDRTIRLWEVASGKEIQRFEGHADSVSSVKFLGEHFLASAASDGSVRIWSIPAGKELCQLISLGRHTTMVDERDEWVVVTPDGRFDTNKDLDQIEGLHWILSDHPLSPVPLETFMRDYYEPKLLPRLLRCTEEHNCDHEFPRLPDIAQLNRVKPQVAITNITLPDDKWRVKVTVEVARGVMPATECKRCETDVFDLRLFRDGQIVGSFPADSLEKLNAGSDWRQVTKIDVDEKTGKRTLVFDVQLPRGKDPAKVSFTAYAFNEDRIKSDNVTWNWPDDLKAKLPRPEFNQPRAYIVSIGINASENAELNLQYAANDARGMQQVFGDSLKDLNGYEVIRIPLISDRDPKGQLRSDATKKKIEAVFRLLAGKSLDQSQSKLVDEISERAPDVRKIEKATPDDLVLVAFSTHGFADNKGNFFLLPSDVGPSDQKKTLLPLAISSSELSLWFRDIDGGEMVLIIDACQAAAAVENPEFKPGPMGSRGLGQLAYDKGMKILSATQSSDFALESDRLQQGLLSYALLAAGLTAKQADFEPAPDGQITLREWLNFGVLEVPKLYEDIKDGKRNLISSDGKKRGSEVVDGGTLSFTQQPTLFDFKRKTKSAVIARTSR